jgi:lipopolysaccharide transport system permease protein
MSFVLSIVCTRFRDVIEIIKNLMQVMFYATPIIWGSEMLPKKVGDIILNFNPFYHLITIIREPLLGQIPTFLNWVIPVSMALIGWIFALTFFGHYRKRVAYWL